MAKYYKGTMHDLTYYKKFLLCVAQGLALGLSHKEIVQRLNAENIPSPVGDPFTVSKLSSTLTRLRNPEVYRCNAHFAMLRLYYQGQMSKEHCALLLTRHAGTLA